MDSKTLRCKYLYFFQTKGHVLISPSKLIPENDPTTLFTSSGMQQLVPYLKGEVHPKGDKLVDSQPSFRAEDMEEVGDNRHTTFFEMLGNWSLGSYFKKEQLTWIFDFLVNEINLDPKNLYVTIFVGSALVPKDIESEKIWKELFSQANLDFEFTVNQNPQQGMKPTDKIFYYNDKNWWSRAGTPEKMPIGEVGGPDSEVFYDFDPEGKLQIHKHSKFKDKPCHPNCDCGRFLEIGNSVFMQYVKTEAGFKPLPKQNVDFGGGLERLTAASQDERDIFQTDLFLPMIKVLENETARKYEEDPVPFQIIADHLKAAIFMISQGLEPSNKMQGYILRRLIRRSILKIKKLGKENVDFADLVRVVGIIYEGVYDEILQKQEIITQLLQNEASKFSKTLNKGLKEFEKLASTGDLNGQTAFKLFETFGFPFELTQELALDQNITLSLEDFNQAKNQHSDNSRTASVGMFKGGLADNSEKVVKLHTATHLLNQALRLVLSQEIKQAGANINSERLRFDFTYDDKLTEEQRQEIEKIVNEQISKNLPVFFEEMVTKEAFTSGANGVFGERYGDKVKVYFIGDKEKPFSKEICGGPHVVQTGVLGQFTLGKEKSIGAGKRRIYGFLK
ncbi:alanine--tRNA ligase [Candidatus Beckwithbacteria bacterium]|nr:alanine--tRNA ligase [Candidatus Beckwithbacteria bacterium]